MLEFKDVGLHCRYMGLANFADSLDDRLHAIAVAKGTAMPAALMTWRADTVKKMERLQQEVSKLEGKAQLLSVNLHEQPDSFSRGAGIRSAAPILNVELRYVKVHLELDGLRSLAAKQVQIGLAADSSVSAAISDAARNSQRLEQLQKQFDRLQSTLGSDFKPGTPQFCCAVLQKSCVTARSMLCSCRSLMQWLTYAASSSCGQSMATLTKSAGACSRDSSKNARSPNNASGSCRAGWSTTTAARQGVRR